MSDHGDSLKLPEDAGGLLSVPKAFDLVAMKNSAKGGPGEIAETAARDGDACC